MLICLAVALSVGQPEAGVGDSVLHGGGHSELKLIRQETDVEGIALLADRHGLTVIGSSLKKKIIINKKRK